MIGRWTGAAGAFEIGAGAKKMLMLILPFVAFGVFLAVNSIMGHDVTQFYGYVAMIAVMIVVTLMTRGNPARMLLYFAVCGAAALLIGMFTTGTISAMAFISSGLFCSTMWPCVFALAIAGLGKHTNQGSSLLIMMIMGGAFIPLLQGGLSDFVGTHASFWVGVVCFAYLGFYALRASGALKEQGIDLDKLSAEGGH
jgi:FHS family L-fucose permease-like MFS transporter